MSWVSNYNKFGANRTPVMQGLSSTDNVTPVPVAVDPATGEILTSSTGGGSTQYTNGQAVTTPTGTVALGYDGANVRALNTDISGNLYTKITGEDLVDSNNSSTTNLTSNATFTGTGTSTIGYAYITVYVYSNVSSATNGVQIQFSSDNTNWNDASLFTFTSGGTAPNNGQTFGASVRGQYYRIIYTNGGTAQTTFRLQTVIKDHYTGGDMVTMTNVPNSTNHAILTKSSIVGLTTAGGGGYVDVKVNPSGSLTTASNIFDSNGSNIVLGQTTMSASLPVAIASNQTAIPVTQSGTWNVGLNAGTNNIGNVGTVLGSVNVGQTTSSTSAVQLNGGTSITATNGIIVQALKANTATVYLGGSGVTTTSGFELQAGQAISFACTNINNLYVIGSNTSDKVCWSVL